MQKTPIPPLAVFGDTTPRKNPAAVKAYRCARLGMIPGVAFIFAPLAVYFGVIAMRNYRANHKVAGRGHALVGMMLGTGAFISNIVGWWCIAYGQGWI